jgi:hypothetical protein
MPQSPHSRQPHRRRSQFTFQPTCHCPQYVDALRLGDLSRWLEIEKETELWYFPTLDRGAGATLHFAADHGQLRVAKFLVGAA